MKDEIPGKVYIMEIYTNVMVIYVTVSAVKPSKIR
jgi:hypothetical protein